MNYSTLMVRQLGSLLMPLTFLHCCGATNIMHSLNILARSLGNEIVTECDLIVLGSVSHNNIQDIHFKGTRAILQFASLDTLNDTKGVKFPNSPCLVLFTNPIANQSDIADMGSILQKYKPFATLVYGSSQYPRHVNDNLTNQDILFPFLILNETGKHTTLAMMFFHQHTTTQIIATLTYNRFSTCCLCFSLW